MKRRDLLGLASAAVAFPRVAFAQQAAKVPRIVIVSLTYTDDRLKVLSQALAAAGYIDGKTATIEFFVAPTIADTDAYVQQALAQKPDLIMTMASPAPLALKALGTTIPVVLVNIADPLAIGLVSSYAHPGGSMTGTMQGAPDLVAKHFGFLREIAPGAKRVARFGDPTDAPHAAFAAQADAAATGLGMDIVAVDLKGGDDFAATFARLASAGVDAIYFEGLNLVTANMPTLAALAETRNMPSVGGAASHARMGALLGYSSNTNEVVRHAVPYVDAILKGAKPGDLPIEYPSVFDFVVNMRTAKAIGITVPQSILVQATEVIQ